MYDGEEQGKEGNTKNDSYCIQESILAGDPGFMRAYPSVQQLKCFLAVTEQLSFRSAAESLHLSQPPLSRHIKALEGLVGVQLFERDTHSVVPTEAGVRLARQARGILAALDQALEEARAAGEHPVETFRVGITRVVDPSAFPNIETLVRELGYFGPVSEEHATTPQLIEMMAAGRLDLAMILTPPDFRPDLEYAPLHREPLVVAMADGLNVPAGPLSFADLPGVPLFWLRRKDNPVLYDTAEQIFAEHGYAPERRPKPGHRDALFNKIAAGEGIGFIPASVTATRRSGVRYRRFAPEIEAKLGLSLQLVRRAGEARAVVLSAAEALRIAMRAPRDPALWRRGSAMVGATAAAVVTGA